MSQQVLSSPVFGGGVVREGSSDAQRTDELSECDGYDIGARGQLVAASDVSSYANASGAGALDVVYGLHALAAPALPRIVYAGDQAGATFLGFAGLDGTVPGGVNVGGTVTTRYIATFADFPIVLGGTQLRLILAAVSARAAFAPRTGPGLFALIYDPAGPAYNVQPISDFDALGTGADGEFAGGTHGQQLYPRGVVAYNGHALLWGFDSADATTGEGSNRVMFCNINNPLKWGNDPDAAGVADGTTTPTDRTFGDSDAVLIGGVGVVIRAGVVWATRCWFAASNGLHYIEGYGRESFMTNGAVPIRKSRGVVGPHALIEGPDGLLHGVDDTGHWIFDGSTTDPVGEKLRKYSLRSPGCWDLIWTDPLRTPNAYPGQTNQDLVWMMADTELHQVLIGIPFCSATAGFGPGNDTVVLKYHTRTGGYTRQVFSGKIILSAIEFRREHTAERATYMGGTTLATNIMRYRYKSALNVSPALPSTLPDVTFGEYAPFGPTGVGVMRQKYLTLAWESSAALPLVFALTPTIDGQTLGAMTLSVQATEPAAPANGDIWVDTSGTDTNLGNGTAGSLVASNAADFLFKSYVTSWAKWVQLAGGGQQGTRVSIPIAFNAARGTRFKVRMQCTAASGRWQVENFADKPSAIRAGA